jgi:hypothetical protein
VMFVMHLPQTAFKFMSYFWHLKLQNLQ